MPMPVVVSVVDPVVRRVMSAVPGMVPVAPVMPPSRLGQWGDPSQHKASDEEADCDSFHGPVPPLPTGGPHGKPAVTR
ncbi:MAG: hypothetical protein ACE5HL_13240, partial [Terriglobia bacterium]